MKVRLPIILLSYKSWLVCTLVDQTCKVNNTWAGFHLDIDNLTKTLRKNLFSSNAIKNVVRKFLNNNFTSNSSQSAAHWENFFYFKLPYIGPFSITRQCRIKKLVSTFCSNRDIKLAFTQFKIKSWFGVKDPILVGWQLQVIYKLSCAGCSACYVGEANRHIANRIRVNISPLTNIPTSSSTWEVLKIVPAFVCS